MEKNELLPCPFCGSAGYVTKNPFTGHYSVKCKACGAKMTGEMVSSTKAIEEWNRRDNQKEREMVTITTLKKGYEKGVQDLAKDLIEQFDLLVYDNLMNKFEIIEYIKAREKEVQLPPHLTPMAFEVEV